MLELGVVEQLLNAHLCLLMIARPVGDRDHVAHALLDLVHFASDLRWSALQQRLRFLQTPSFPSITLPKAAVATGMAASLRTTPAPPFSSIKRRSAKP